jgi:hypothetical protein
MKTCREKNAVNFEVNVYGVTHVNITIIFKCCFELEVICTNLPPLALDNQPKPGL